MKNKYISFIRDKKYRFRAMAKMGLLNWLSDRKFIEKLYELEFNNKIDLDNPQSFNEKIQWLKLNDRKPVYSLMVDKYEAKKYVASIIGEKYIIPTYGVWDKFDDIDFSKMPSRFVLKCTHDSGGLVIVKDKSTFDKELAKKTINKCMRRNFYYTSREWPYKDVKPRIIAEEYMEDSTTRDLRDYKVHVFNGIPKLILVCQNRFSEEGLTEDFFDIEWNHLDTRREKHPNSTHTIQKPLNLQEMIRISEILAKDIPFLRIDFYAIGNKVYFGETTFYPASGFEKFVPESFDFEMGKWLKLPEIMGE